MNKVYYINGKPWKDCPFKLQAAVITKKGEDEVIRVWREFYHNDALEPEEIIEIPFIKGEIDEPATDEHRAPLS